MNFSSLVAALISIVVAVLVNGATPPTATTLELLQILYRHGDRTPTTVYPKDPFADYWNAIGLGQLTNRGMQQQLELGAYIRRRYSNFLNATYDARQVVVRSTDVDRTLMSAQANLAGLYPPVGTQVWNATIRWQPIPVHSVPEADDHVLKSCDADCPRYKEVTNQVLNSPEVQQILNDNKVLLDMLTNETGKAMDTLSAINGLYDTIFVEKANNLAQPSWVTDAVVNRLHELVGPSFVYLSHTNEQMRLNGGPLLKEMLANVNERITANATVVAKQLFAYSAHDTTMSALLSVLGSYNGLSPPYASVILVELHRIQNSTSFALQFLFRNTTTEEPHILILADCPALCPLERVIELTKGLVPDDVDVECQCSASYIPWTVAIVTGVLTVAFVVALLFGFLYWRKRKRSLGFYRYTIVNED